MSDELRSHADKIISILCKFNRDAADDLSQEAELVILEIEQDKHRAIGVGKFKYLSQRLRAIAKAAQQEGVSLFTPIGEDGSGQLIDMIEPKERIRPQGKRRLVHAVNKFQRYRHKCSKEHRCPRCGDKIVDRKFAWCLVCRLKNARRRLFSKSRSRTNSSKYRVILEYANS